MLASITGRENQIKTTSLADLRANTDGEIELRCDPLDEVESHSGRLGGLVTIMTGKAVLKDPLLVSSRDTDALIANGEGMIMPGDGDRTASGRILNGIGEKLVDAEAQPLGIGQHVMIEVDQVRDQLPVDEEGRVLLNYRVDEICQVNSGELVVVAGHRQTLIV